MATLLNPALNKSVKPNKLTKFIDLPISLNGFKPIATVLNLRMNEPNNLAVKNKALVSSFKSLTSASSISLKPDSLYKHCFLIALKPFLNELPNSYKTLIPLENLEHKSLIENKPLISCMSIAVHSRAVTPRLASLLKLIMIKDSLLSIPLHTPLMWSTEPLN